MWNYPQPPTKVERYRTAKEAAKRIRDDVERALETEPDKPLLYTRMTSIGQYPNEPRLSVEMMGNHLWGRRYPASQQRVFGECLADAITERMTELVKRAVEIADERAENARLAAQSEANTVITKTEGAAKKTKAPA